MFKCAAEYEPHFKFIKVVMQKQDQPRERVMSLMPETRDVSLFRHGITSMSEGRVLLRYLKQQDDSVFSLGLTSYTDDY